MRAPELGIRLVDGQFEHVEHVVPNADRVIEILEPERVLCQRRQAEVIGLATHRENQVIVRNLARFRLQFPRRQVDTTDSGNAEIEIALTLQDRPHRLRDVARAKAGSRHLVKERLEKMIVVTVNERHTNRRVAQAGRNPQATEARADNNNSGFQFAHRLIPEA